MKAQLEKLPSFGAIVAAAGCPICFPALAAVGSVFGLGAIAAYESQLIIVSQIFLVLSAGFAVVSFRRTKKKATLILSFLSVTVIFGSWYLFWNTTLIYIGFAGVFAAAVGNIVFENRVRKCGT